MIVKSNFLGRLASAGQLISAGSLFLTLLGCGGGADVAQTDPAPVASAHLHAAPMQAGEQRVASSWIGTGIGTTLSPADLHSHYNMPTSVTGAGQTIAIVDAPGSGNIANDLNTFSTYYHLPLCNSANPCLQKIDLSNGKTVSRTNDWATEIALDVEWAHAVAPAAKIVLVIAASSSMTDMFNAVRTAAAQPNVAAVSMSWGATEYSSETSSAFDGLFASYPGVVFLASSGDAGNNGSNQCYPAASPYVTAVGGTSIKSLALTSRSSEVAWSLSGGGASIYEAMPIYQTSYLTGTNSLVLNKGKRAIPDVSYNADNANSPVGVYANSNWYAVGGTSAGAPQWAGITALFSQYLQKKGSLLSTLVRGNSGFNNLIYQAKIQQGSQVSFFDVTIGSDQTGRGVCALCVAGVGYDDVTGLGVPNVGNFLGHF
jgi:subtilase family serine protease